MALFKNCYADYVLPKARIKDEIKNREFREKVKLTRKQVLELENDPGNLQNLEGRFNMPKGAKVEPVEGEEDNGFKQVGKNRPVHPNCREFLKNDQQRSWEKFDQSIKEMFKKNRNSLPSKQDD